MNFQNYQAEIEKFCIYPEIGQMGIVYPVLGLIGEIGEAFLDRDGFPNIKVDIFELGDVFFYATRVLSHLNRTYHPSNKKQRNTLNQSILSVVQSATVISEATKKLLRDNNLEKIDTIFDETFYIFGELCNIAHVHGFNVEEVLDTNHNKLQDRLNRDVIKGDGDNR